MGLQTSNPQRGAWSEDEGQDALHSDRRPVEDCWFEDPFTRRFYGRAPQHKLTADSLGLDDEPRFRDRNLHLDLSCRLHLLGGRRINRYDFGDSAALRLAFRNLLYVLRRGRRGGRWRRGRRWQPWRLLRQARAVVHRRKACKHRPKIEKRRDDPRRVHFNCGQNSDSFFSAGLGRAFRSAQLFRQIAQPADLIEPLVLFDDCAEEGRLSGQPFFESPDTDCDEYFLSARQAGVDFSAGWQIFPRLDLLPAFGQLPDHAGLRADDLAEPARKGAVGQRLVEVGSEHLLRRRNRLFLERTRLTGHRDTEGQREGEKEGQRDGGTERRRDGGAERSRENAPPPL